MSLRILSIIPAAAAALGLSSCSKLNSLEDTAFSKIDKMRGRAPIVEVDKTKLREFKTGEELALAYQSAVRRNRRTGEALPDWIISGEYDDLLIPELDGGVGEFSVLPTKPQ